MAEDYDNYDDEDISESPEYSPKSDFSKAQKVGEAFSKVVEVRAKEMKPGYYNFSVDRNGLMQKIWIPDARVIFIGAVESLKNILTPEISRDESCKKELKKINEKIKEVKEKYSYEELLLDYKKDELTDVLIPYYKKTGYKIMPEIDDEVVAPTMGQDGKVVYSPINGGWNKKVNIYRNILVSYYDDIFAELNKLIDRLNYFKAGLSF